MEELSLSTMNAAFEPLSITIALIARGKSIQVCLGLSKKYSNCLTKLENEFKL